MPPRIPDYASQLTDLENGVLHWRLSAALVEQSAFHRSGRGERGNTD